ncbi:hypothetical protein [Actinomycetospora aeridis]|uniref:Uncharacterized protein n=1 Tax=Actinomycetospora aeridis TaxID=3129231 RepID=A0ABU8NE97_9PSEU
MTVVGTIVCLGFLAVLGTRVGLTEAVWPEYRVRRTQRRVVHGLDLVAVLLVLVLLATLAAVMGPFLLS